MKLIYKKAKLIREIDDVRTGEAFAEYRNKNRLSQIAVATNMGVFPSFVSALESGNRHWKQKWADSYVASVKNLTK